MAGITVTCRQIKIRLHAGLGVKGPGLVRASFCSLIGYREGNGRQLSPSWIIMIAREWQSFDLGRHPYLMGRSYDTIEFPIVMWHELSKRPIYMAHIGIPYFSETTPQTHDALQSNTVRSI